MIIKRTVKLKYGDELKKVNLMFKEIDYDTAKKMIIENHYSHKWNTSFGKINVGVFYENELMGVASYGNLMNPKSYKRFNKNFEQGNVIELNRLWIDDRLGGNAETVLMKSSFKIIKSCYPKIKAVQSFADGRLGCGTIYKAMNFKYYGYLETLFYEDIETGVVYHKVPMENTKRPDGMVKLNTMYILGKLKPFKVKTYRYIMPLYKNVKIEMEEKPYPKYDIGIKYLENYKHSPALIARAYILAEMLGWEQSEVLKDHIKKHELTPIIKKQLENKSLDFVAQKRGLEDKLEKIRKYFGVKLKSREVPVVNCEPPRKQYNIFDFMEE